MLLRTASLVVLVPAALAGQRPDTTMLPRDLAVALIAAGGFGDASPRIVVGRLPDERLARLVPRDARVLGGATFEGSRYGGPRSTTILSVPHGLDSALKMVASTFEGAGLKQAPTFESMGRSGGFVSIGPEIPNMLAFCGDVGSVSASVVEADRGSLVRLSSSRSVRNTQCDSTIRMRMRDRSGEELEMPTLRPPPGVTGGGSSGSGGSDESREAHTMLRGAISAEALLDHFAPQLREQGWTTANRVTDGDLSVLTARKTNARGEPLYLVLTDARYGPREHSVSLRVWLQTPRDR